MTKNYGNKIEKYGYRIKYFLKLDPCSAKKKFTANGGSSYHFFHHSFVVLMFNFLIFSMN